MAITKFTGTTTSIQSLPDRPNQTVGFTPADLKIRFDQFAIDSKAWFNDVMSVEIDALLLSANTNATTALNGVSAAQLGAIPDGILTEVKMANEMKKDIIGGITAYNTFLAQLGDLTTLSTTSKVVTGAINELFINANNGKQNWVDVVGTPLINTDAFATLKDKTQTLKNTMASNLTIKGQTSTGTESLTGLINKIALVSTGKKWASGTTTLNSDGTFAVMGLAFTSSLIIVNYTQVYTKTCVYGVGAGIDGYVFKGSTTQYNALMFTPISVVGGSFSGKFPDITAADILSYKAFE